MIALLKWLFRLLRFKKRREWFAYCRMEESPPIGTIYQDANGKRLGVVVERDDLGLTIEFDRGC